MLHSRSVDRAPHLVTRPVDSMVRPQQGWHLVELQRRLARLTLRHSLTLWIAELGHRRPPLEYSHTLERNRLNENWLRNVFRVCPWQCSMNGNLIRHKNFDKTINERNQAEKSHENFTRTIYVCVIRVCEVTCGIVFYVFLYSLYRFDETKYLFKNAEQKEKRLNIFIYGRKTLWTVSLLNMNLIRFCFFFSSRFWR